MWDFAVTSFTTLFVTIDPLGLAPVFLALTAGMNRTQRRQVGFRSCVIALVVLILFSLAGTAVLGLFGITMPAFRIAGGLLLFAIAFEMIFERRQERHERSAERAITNDDVRTVSAFPLAIPLIAGPGAISAVILLSANAPTPAYHSLLLGQVALILAMTWGIFTAAERIERAVGDTGRIVVTRLFGVILAALSVQFVGEGILSFIRQYAAA